MTDEDVSMQEEELENTAEPIAAGHIEDSREEIVAWVNRQMPIKLRLRLSLVNKAIAVRREDPLGQARKERATLSGIEFKKVGAFGDRKIVLQFLHTGNRVSDPTTLVRKMLRTAGCALAEDESLKLRGAESLECKVLPALSAYIRFGAKPKPTDERPKKWHSLHYSFPTRFRESRPSQLPWTRIPPDQLAALEPRLQPVPAPPQPRPPRAPQLQQQPVVLLQPGQRAPIVLDDDSDSDDDEDISEDPVVVVREVREAEAVMLAQTAFEADRAMRELAAKEGWDNELNPVAQSRALEGAAARGLRHGDAMVAGGGGGAAAVVMVLEGDEARQLFSRGLQQVAENERRQEEADWLRQAPARQRELLKFQQQQQQQQQNTADAPNAKRQRTTDRDGPTSCTSHTTTTSADTSSEKRDEDTGLCRVCYERPINTVLIPCGHFGFCSECTTPAMLQTTRRKCFVCKTPVTAVQRVYTI